MSVRKKNDRKRKKRDEISYCPEFTKPTVAQAEEARGSYPWSEDLVLLNKRIRLVGIGQESTDKRVAYLADINCPQFYTNHRSKSADKTWWDELPPPINDNAWLTTYIEDGQTFDDYVGKYISDYRQRQGDTIYLLPIVQVDHERQISQAAWSSHAPSLNELARWISAFYYRRCEVLPPASVYPCSEVDEDNKDKASFWFHYDQFDVRKKIFGRISGTEEEENFNTISSSQNPSFRSQVRVQDCLVTLESLKQHPQIRQKAISVVGVTMIDLLSHKSDLFVAGFAGRGVSMLSLRRYHPRIIMSDTYWDDYAYHSAYHPQNATYLNSDGTHEDTDAEDESNNSKKRSKSAKRNDQKPKVEVSMIPPKLTFEEKSEFFRRAGRLITHELGHNYGFEHCIHHHCYMNGSGNLMEDFATPATECGLCLRKLQFRLGFSVINRYQSLLEVFTANGMEKEALFIQERLTFLSPSSGTADKSVEVAEKNEEDVEFDTSSTQTKRVLSKKIVIDLTDES